MEMEKLLSHLKKVSFVTLIIFILCRSSYAQECYKLIRVIDGDTIKILYRHKKVSVRLLGIDTPESRENKRAYYQAKRTRQDVKTIIELGKQAKSHLKHILSGYKKVCLVYDQNNAYSKHRDKYGRVLAYVYTPDGKFVNELMLKDGYAYLLTKYPLEPQYEKLLRRAYREAVENGRGLWGNGPSTAQEDTNGQYHCGEKKYCSQMTSCEEAMFYYKTCGIERLDRDKDGMPCEKLCR